MTTFPSGAEEPTAVQAALERLALGASFICLLAAILLAVFPGWVIDLL